ncbi:MAG: TonB-dependent receptor domain-containing protein, partial [Deltaproteobacteria bacterium]
MAVSEMKTGFHLNLQSDANGAYVTPPLKVGVYSVSVEAKGFRPEKRENLVLQVQDRLRVDFQLQVGAVTEEVVVTEEAPAVQSETSSLGQVITSRQITDLPLNGRDYIQLATLTTGVVRTSEGTNGNVGGSSTGGLNSFVANGARGTLNNFLLDGIDNNSNDNGGVVLRTNVDAIQEFKVQTNGYSAEFGRSGGGVINAVIKSGTNELHGSLFEFFRNSALDARGFFEDPSQKKASFKQNQFGGTIGGPIRRDKVFFFGDYQGTRIRNPLTFVSSVPTLSQKTGDFSGPGNNIIYDPSSYDAATNSRVPFGGNRVPQDQIVALSQNYMNLYPGPNQADKLRNNFIISPNERDRVDQMDARADYNIKETDQLFGRFSLSDRTDFRPAPLPGLANGGGSSTGFAFEVTRGAAVGYTHTFTPTSVNDLRLGFSYVNVHRGIPEGGTQFPPPELQVPGVVNNPKTNGLTIFAPSGYRRVGDPGFAPTLLASQERQISDSLSLIRGRHSLKAGGQVRWSQFNIFQVSRPRGNFSFNGRFTQNPESRSGTGSPLADMLLGLPSSSTISSLLDLGNRQQVYSMFVEDNWKVTPKLTLNLGLRYEYATPIVEVNDKQSNFDFATGQIVVANRNGQSRGLVDVDKFNLGPRIGFAYSPFQDGKTVIRGAYGIFYSLQEIKTAGGLQLAYNVPFFYEPSFISNGITPVLTVPQGFPPLDPTQAVTPPVTSLDRRLHSPSYQQWNFGIQRVLPTQTTLEVAYVGSKGTHLQGLTDHDQIALPG